MAQTGKSKLAQKLGARANKVLAEHSKDEIDYGNRRLPGGVRGVARLTKCYFAEYKTGDLKGKTYYRAEAVVVESDPPEYVGSNTSDMEPLCDTKKKDYKTGQEIVINQDDHLVVIMNKMRKLDPDALDGATIDILEDIAASLANAGIYFPFDTTQGSVTKQFPKPKVFENWYGAKDIPADYVEPGSDKATTADNTALAPASAPPAATPQQSTPSDAQAPADEGDDGLAALAECAENDNDPEQVAAQQELERIADGVGIDADTRDKEIPSWVALVDAIHEAQAEAAAPPEEAPAAPPQPALAAASAAVIEPVKGKTYKYKPKGKTRAVGCECTAVNKLKKVCDLLNNDDNTTKYAAVPWADLRS